MMEIRFDKTGEERKALVTAISEITGVKAQYLGAPGFAYNVGGYPVSRGGAVDTGDMPAEDISFLLAALAERGFVSGQTDTEQCDTGPDNDNGRMTIEALSSGLTGTAVKNLEKMVLAKAWILRKMTGADALPILREESRLRFPWFRRESTAAEVGAYSMLIERLCATAKEKQRVTASERPLTDGDNEKFKARCFLLSLGFIGKEYSAARKILLAPMSGNGSHKSGDGKGSNTADPAAANSIAGDLDDAEPCCSTDESVTTEADDSFVRGGLCCVPPTDCNYMSYLRKATDAQLCEAVTIMESNPKGNNGRIAVCRRELNKRGAAV
jgi:hypothetical protein